MTNADRAKLISEAWDRIEKASRYQTIQVTGPGEPDEWNKGTKITFGYESLREGFLRECDLLMEAARAGAIEECAKVVRDGWEQDRHVYDQEQKPLMRSHRETIAKSLDALLNPSSPPAAEGARE